MMALNWPAPWASFFEGLRRTSWQAAILVCLIAAMQLLFRRRLSPRWRCHLWLLVVIKLAWRRPPKTQLSLFNVFRTGGRQPAAARLGLLPILTQIAEPPPTAARAVAPPNVMPL